MSETSSGLVGTVLGGRALRPMRAGPRRTRGQGPRQRTRSALFDLGPLSWSRDSTTDRFTDEPDSRPPRPSVTRGEASASLGYCDPWSHHPELALGTNCGRAPGLRSGPRMQGRLGPRVRTGGRGRVDDRENVCPRLGLSGRPGPGTDLRHRGAGRSRSDTAVAFEEGSVNRQFASLVLVRDARDGDSGRDRTDNGVNRFSVRPSQRLNNSCTTTCEGLPARSRRPSEGRRSTTSRPNPTLRGSSAL